MSATLKLDAPVADLPAQMTANFMQVASGVDVAPLLAEIVRQPELWNKNPCRLSRHGPHHETQDMFLRYRDETAFRETGDWSAFSDAHLGVWNQTIDYLPSALKLIFDLMAGVRAEVLGGVFIYKIPPGKQIYPHVDYGWHPAFYDKFNICLASNADTRFYYERGAFTQTAGDVHWFRNTVEHGVINEGASDHIILTVCASIDRGQRAPWSPEGWTMDGSRSAISGRNLMSAREG